MTGQPPRVDVLIPHFNDPAGMALSLASVSAQTYTGGFRVVVLDDGSSPDNLARLRQTLDRSGLSVTLAVSPINQGRALTRTALVEMIDSPLVAWLDAGDEWMPDKALRQWQVLESMDYSDKAWVTCNYELQWPNTPPALQVQHVGGDQQRLLLEGRALGAYLWTLFGTASSFRSNAPFDPELSRLQDLDYVLRFVSNGGVLQGAGTDAPLCRYHKSDVGRNARQIHACYMHIFRRHRPVYESYGSAFVRERLADMHMLGLRVALNNGEHGLALRYGIGALRQRPLYFVSRVLRRFAKRAGK